MSTPVATSCSRAVLALIRSASPHLRRQQVFPRASSSSVARVAVLYQELEPPLINGTRKPKKPGGYRDSGADIAYNLSQTQSQDIRVLTPSFNPSATKDSDWPFPDTEEGILAAIDRGATHLWANTILFAAHPLQTSSRIVDHVRVIGQAPLIVDSYDDKNYVNDLLRATGMFSMPKAWSFAASQGQSPEFEKFPYPIIAKPARGRGSHGVKLCHTSKELQIHYEALLEEESGTVIIEEYLAGEEATVTVMPPSAPGGQYWSLPVVTRFNHRDSIALYNGVVAVTQNSRAVLESNDTAYDMVRRECEEAAAYLGVTAPIRIDVRRGEDGCVFKLFDVNMKPNMTGPGRPGRDDQASLTLMAGAALGWDYGELLRQVLRASSTLGDLRILKPR